MNNHDDMKKLMEAVDPSRLRTITEMDLSENEADYMEAAEELSAIGDQIEELVYEAQEILRQLGPEGQGAVSRARAYWIPQILGTVGLNHDSTSMNSMAETIKELQTLYSGEDDFDPIGQRNADERYGPMDGER